VPQVAVRGDLHTLAQALHLKQARAMTEN